MSFYKIKKIIATGGLVNKYIFKNEIKQGNNK